MAFVYIVVAKGGILDAANGSELVEPPFQEMGERQRELKQKGRELVEALFRQAAEREQQQVRALNRPVA